MIPLGIHPENPPRIILRIPRGFPPRCPPQIFTKIPQKIPKFCSRLSIQGSLQALFQICLQKSHDVSKIPSGFLSRFSAKTFSTISLEDFWGVLYKFFEKVFRLCCSAFFKKLFQGYVEGLFWNLRKSSEEFFQILLIIREYFRIHQEFFWWFVL